MITSAQEVYIARHAYLPEQAPPYVAAISQTEPHLFGEFLAYAKPGHLIFVGYPLQAPVAEKGLESALADALASLRPAQVSLIAPAVPPSLRQHAHPPTDHYYRLDLSTLSPSQKLRNMLKRAGRELSVVRSRHFAGEHRQMVEAFCTIRPASAETRFIFQRIDAYLAASETAAIFEARDGNGELVAFDIAESMPEDYALYMFNFRSPVRYVPGASDLLLAAVARQAAAEGKKYVNLGLGINPGVAFFKEKWGGVPFLPHAACLYRPPRKGFLEMLLRGL